MAASPVVRSVGRSLGERGGAGGLRAPLIRAALVGAHFAAGGLLVLAATRNPLAAVVAAPVLLWACWVRFALGRRPAETLRAELWTALLVALVPAAAGMLGAIELLPCACSGHRVPLPAPAAVSPPVAVGATVGALAFGLALFLRLDLRRGGRR